MKFAVKSLINQAVKDNSEFIIENVAEYLLSDVDNREFAYYEYLSDEEIEQYEECSNRREELEQEVRSFIQENYNYDIVEKNVSQNLNDTFINY